MKKMARTMAAAAALVISLGMAACGGAAKSAGAGGAAASSAAGGAGTEAADAAKTQEGAADSSAEDAAARELPGACESASGASEAAGAGEKASGDKKVIQPAGKKKDAADKAPAPAGKTADASLAARLAGKYVQPGAGDSADECYTLEILDVHGNLYAMGGYAMDDGDPGANAPLEAYSFWAMEIIPADPSVLSDETADRFEAGVLKFSVMSNMTRYWSSPELFEITLTDKGFDAKSKNGMNTFSFARDERAESAFTDMGAAPEGGGSSAPAGLAGLWKERYSDAPVFLSFGDGAFEFYRKKPGTEVRLSRGSFSAGEHSISAVYQTLGNGGQSGNSEWDYELTKEEGRDLLILRAENGGLSESGMANDYMAVFEPAAEDDVPLAALAEPDDAEALAAGAEASGRPLVRQFLASDEVENNGGHFVKVGDLVYFRAFDDPAEPVTGLWGEFLSSTPLMERSKVCWYDPATGKTGTAFTDHGTGPLYYMDGRFYMDNLEVAGDGTGRQAVMRCWPDGSGMEQVSESGFATIEGISEDGRRLCIHEYGEERCYITDGTSYITEFPKGENEDIRFAGFSGSDLILFTNDEEDVRGGISQVPEEGVERLYLGRLPEQKLEENFGIPELVQMYRDGEDLYLGFTWREGTAMMLSDYLAVKVVPGKADSLTVVQDGRPEGDAYEDNVPWLYVNGMGEVAFSEHRPEGEVFLSGVGYGDLVYADSPFGATMLRKDFIAESPYDMSDGDRAKFLIAGEYVDGAVYLITAEGLYTPADDIGWRMSYTMDRMDWQRIPVSGGEGAAKADDLGSLTVPAEKKSALAAYEEVLAKYRLAAAENYTSEQMAEAGIGFGLAALGWPVAAVPDETTYLFRDIDGNGVPELLILYMGRPVDIFGYDGHSALSAYSTPYRGEAVLYEDGMLEQRFGTMSSASNTWYRMDGRLGIFLPVAERQYDPGDESKAPEYYVYAAEGAWEDIEKAVAETGEYPVWAWEWGDELTGTEYLEYISHAKEVKLPMGNPL